MDGRRFRRWWLSGCLVAGSVGCHRNAVQSPWDPPAPSSAGLLTSKKSFWDRGPKALPVEVPADATRKGPPRAETEVAFADARLEAAFDEKTPPANREVLLDQARQGYQRAIEREPKNLTAILGLARYYARVEDRPRAVEQYKKYLAMNPKDRDVAHEVAITHARWRDWDGAVAWCDFALKLDPENLTFRKTKGFCLARAGRWDDALAVLGQIMPEAQARYNLARVLEHQNQPEASKQQLLAALQADQNYAPAREFLAELDQPQPGPAGVPDPNAIQRAGYTEQP